MRCVIACFGPTDLHAFSRGSREEILENPIFAGLLGGQALEDVLRGMSPISEIVSGKAYPPMLLAAGDADDVVPYEQNERMFHALTDAGVDARLIRVIGAPHEAASEQPAARPVRGFQGKAVTGRSGEAAMNTGNCSGT